MEAIPPECRHALDAGCGQGALARRLARHARAVTAIDVDPGCLAAAAGAGALNPSNLGFVCGDILGHPFAPASFDFISSVATLHHLPLNRALTTFRDLLTPGGTLAIIGVYRATTPADYAVSACALPVSRAIRAVRGEAEIGAPMADPQESLDRIRDAARTQLPGSQVRRLLFFRYLLTWKKP